MILKTILTILVDKIENGEIIFERNNGNQFCIKGFLRHYLLFCVIFETTIK